ncbi:MAG: hypothetical protein WED05_06560 [Candidatus Atabeyarchaeum deiterrae]
MKSSLPSRLTSEEARLADFEIFKEHAKDSIELLMSVESDVNPFGERVLLDEIVADIRKASSPEELHGIMKECRDAVKNVVAAYMEFNRIIERVNGELIDKDQKFAMST